MLENTNITLNLQSPNVATVVYAVQNDRDARHITAQLLDGSAPWTPTQWAHAVIRYLKPDGTGGFYDTDENDNAAVTITGSTANLTLVEQTMTVPGDVYMQLNFYEGTGHRLTTFAWILRVQPSVLSDATIVSSDYYNVLTAAIAAGAEVAQQLTFPVPIANGGTGAADASDALSALGGEPLLITENKTFSASITAGTIGTRGAQVTYTPSYSVDKIISIVVTYIGNSSEYFPIVFTASGTVYCNFYRASSGSSAAECYVRIVRRA